MIRRTLIVLVGWAALAVAQKTNRPVFILLGPPGAGKSTHSKILSDRYKIPVIEAAALLKQAHGGKGQISKSLKVQTAGGDLLGDQGMNDLFLARIRKGDCFNGFILDGYPATKNQADFAAAQIKELTFPPPVVIHLQISDELSKQRMKQRGRADDKAGDPDQKIAEYRAEETAVLGFFPASEVIHVDSSGTPQQVAAAIEKNLAARK